MQVPPTLEAKYNQLIGRYPVKRSALIPMMMYAQDQFGSLSRRSAGGHRRAPRPEHDAGDRDAGVLLDAAPQARGKISHSGLHQHFLHAARRPGTLRTRSEAPGHRQQASFADRHVFAGGSGMHRRLHGRSGDSGELRFLRESRSRQDRRAFRAVAGRQDPASRARDHGRHPRTQSRRNSGDQPALRDEEFAQHRHVSGDGRLSRRSKKR